MLKIFGFRHLFAVTCGWYWGCWVINLCSESHFSISTFSLFFLSWPTPVLNKMNIKLSLRLNCLFSTFSPFSSGKRESSVNSASYNTNTVSNNASCYGRICVQISVPNMLVLYFFFLFLFYFNSARKQATNPTEWSPFVAVKHNTVEKNRKAEKEENPPWNFFIIWYEA